MKRTLTLLSLVAVSAMPAFGQGYMDFSDFTAPITIGSPANPGVSGWYLAGDYSVQAYMLSGAGQLEGVLLPIASSLTQFIGDSTTTEAGGPLSNGAGLFSANVIDTGLAVGVATIQVRAWYNPGGLYSSWEAAFNAGVNVGKSGLYNITLFDSTSPLLASPDSIGMEAFSVAAVPEPSVIALSGFGAVAMLMFRRRK